MTIGGPGGIGGPGAPGGPTGPDGPLGADGPGGPDGPGATQGPGALSGADGASGATPLRELAAAVDSGAVTAQHALDQLIDATLSPALGDAERAELREMITDLAASDPHLAGLLARLDR